MHVLRFGTCYSLLKHSLAWRLLSWSPSLGVPKLSILGRELRQSWGPWNKDPELFAHQRFGAAIAASPSKWFLNLPSSGGFLGPFNVHFLIRASWSSLKKVGAGGGGEAGSHGGRGVQGSSSTSTASHSSRELRTIQQCLSLPQFLIWKGRTPGSL